jgi:predicted amidohydrolase YtcJ
MSLATKLLIFLGAALPSACQLDVAVPAGITADHVFVNGGVYTVDVKQPWAEAVAVVDGRIVKVGDNRDIRVLIGSNTQITDLNGRMLLPSFGDSHLHLLYGGEVSSSCLLSWAEQPDEIARLLRACAEHQAGDSESWIFATRWARWSFAEGNPPAEFLNQLFPDRPVVIEASDGHSFWVNQSALDRVGIDDNTPNPEDGLIARDPVTGRATGLMHESAIQLITARMPTATDRDRKKFIRKAVATAHEFGITAAIEPGLNLRQAKLFAALDGAGELNMRLLLALTPLGWEIAAFDERIYATIKRRSEVESERVAAHSVKVFVDGVIENGTAPLLEPYHDESVQSLDLFFPTDKLQAYFTSLDRQGISIHVHAIGDRGIKQALDAFAGMRRANGMSDNRHLMTHLQLIDKVDIPRFQRLNIIASFATLWAYPEEYNLEIYPPLIGAERVERFYPVASVASTGARVAIGSDWSVEDMNPFLAIEVAITRQDPITDSGSILNPNERIDLALVLEAYTKNVAYAMKLEDQIGSIEPGKFADLVVLDRNLFAIPVQQISQTQVLMTLFNGRQVFVRDLAKSEP